MINIATEMTIRPRLYPGTVPFPFDPVPLSPDESLSDAVARGSPLSRFPPSSMTLTVNSVDFSGTEAITHSYLPES